MSTAASTADADAAEHADPRDELELGGQQHGDVGPDAEEGLVAERDLARVAADDVPGEPHGRPQEDEREDRGGDSAPRSANVSTSPISDHRGDGDASRARWTSRLDGAGAAAEEALGPHVEDDQERHEHADVLELERQDAAG